MIIIKNKWFPFGSYNTINICGILFTKKYDIDNITINHEKIHTKQILELFIIGFYIWYLIEYCIIRFYHKKQGCAYHDISFEEEAYNNQKDLNYIKNRKHYSWFKYIHIKSYCREK